MHTKRSFFTWVIIIIIIIIINQSLLFSKTQALSSSSSSWCQNHHDHHRKFEQKTTIFWEFEEGLNSWVQVKFPYDLVSCFDVKNCTKVGTIDVEKQESNKKKERDERKRVSMMKMTEGSIWVTGESGSIYERFWNGMQWVIVPRHLHVQAGYAASVFFVNQTVFALSDRGILYQMQLTDHSEPMWVECDWMPIRIKSGVISQNRERIYFCTKNGMLIELNEADPPRWRNHGKPPGADVAAIVDVDAVRHHVIFTISSRGELYEFDSTLKQLWKKHIWSKESTQDTVFVPSIGAGRGITSPHSDSIFLITQGGNLVERRLKRRKWKWVVHGCPKGEKLTSITFAHADSLFLTAISGSVFEYNISGQKETWVNHRHPPHSKVAKGISGLHFQAGRLVFPLDDGRLGELHQSRTGGDRVGPSPPGSPRKRVSTSYQWSILEAPESEGWNAEYCTEDRGPLNCITGTKEELSNQETKRLRPTKRRGNKAQEDYHYYYLASSVSSSDKPIEESYVFIKKSVNTNFRLRAMHEGQSFFLVTRTGLTFEYLKVENGWFWLRHDHPTAMKGALGNYNGSLFLVDENNDLVIRERSGEDLTWINCTAMKKGRQVIGGPPWDLTARKSHVSLFFISKTGRLLRLTVARRKWKWKDCGNPWNTNIASIVDQEVLRENIVFVVGMNGRLYQYNKVTRLWHGHYQSPHMVLSGQLGTAMRPWSRSLTGSLFMVSEDGGLIEYHWGPMEGWGWVEHGTPRLGVTLVGSTGPCFGGNQLFLVGSNGEVYLRYLDQGTWKWDDFGCPYDQESEKETFTCDPKVAHTRPIRFMDDSVIFELRDGRLAEMRRGKDRRWAWWRTIATPTSDCDIIYWTAIAS